MNFLGRRDMRERHLDYKQHREAHFGYPRFLFMGPDPTPWSDL